MKYRIAGISLFFAVVALGQLNVRNFIAVNDMAINAQQDEDIQWYQADQVQYDIYVRRGRARVNIPTNAVPIWRVWASATPTTLVVLSTGTVVSATDGHVRFTLTPQASNATTGTYESLVDVAIGSTNIGAIARSQAIVLYSPQSTNVAYQGTVALTSPFYLVAGDTLEGNMNAGQNVLTNLNALYIGSNRMSYMQHSPLVIRGRTWDGPAITTNMLSIGYSSPYTQYSLPIVAGEDAGVVIISEDEGGHGSFVELMNLNEAGTGFGHAAVLMLMQTNTATSDGEFAINMTLANSIGTAVSNMAFVITTGGVTKIGGQTLSDPKGMEVFGYSKLSQTRIYPRDGVFWTNSPARPEAYIIGTDDTQLDIYGEDTALIVASETNGSWGSRIILRDFVGTSVNNDWYLLRTTDSIGGTKNQLYIGWTTNNADHTANATTTANLVLTTNGTVAFRKNVTIGGGLAVTSNSTFSGISAGAVTGTVFNAKTALGMKIKAYSSGATEYGLGVQGNLLQVIAPNSGADIALGHGTSAALTRTMTIDNGVPGVRIGTSTSAPETTLHVDGTISAHNAGTSAGVIQISEDDDDGANFASFTVPALASNTVYTLPADDGDAGEVLQTDGAGTLSWQPDAGGGDSVTVLGVAAVNPDFNNSGNIDFTLTGTTGISASVDGAVVTLDADWDSFAELQAAVSDKTLLNEEDAAIIDAAWTIANNLTVNSNLTIAAGGSLSGTEIMTLSVSQVVAQVAYLTEQAEANADTAGRGQLWVDLATPNVLYFTDDAGTDFRVSFGDKATLEGMLTDVANILEDDIAETISALWTFGANIKLGAGSDILSSDGEIIFDHSGTPSGTNMVLIIGDASGNANGTDITIADATKTVNLSTTGGDVIVDVDGHIQNGIPADIADAGFIRLGNADVIAWEASPAGTDVTLTVDASEVLVLAGASDITVPANSISDEELDEGATFTWTGTHSFSGAAGFTAKADSIALTTDTTGNYAAGDGEAGHATGFSVPVKTAGTNYTAGTDNALEMYGGVIYATAAVTITLPAVASGMNVTVIATTAAAVSVDPNGSDLIKLEGLSLDDGDKITSGATAGEIAVITYYDGTGWYAATDGWSDGGP